MVTELYSQPKFNNTSLVAYYRMEGNGNDSKGSYHGSNIGSCTFSSSYGKFGQGCYQTQTYNQRIEIAHNAALLPTKITVNGWFYFTGGDTLVNKDWGTGYSLWCSSGVPRFSITDQANGRNAVGTTNISNAWHMVTGTYDGTIIRLYVDGVLEGSYSTTATMSGTAALMIGANNYGGGGTGYFDDVSIWNGALQDWEVKELYDWYEPKANYLKDRMRNRMDLSPVSGGNVDLLDGLVSHWKFDGNSLDSFGMNHARLSSVTYGTGKNGQGAVLDSTSDYIGIQPITSPTITIAGWYYYGTANAGNWNTLFCRDAGTYHHILINGDSRIIGFYNAAWYPSSLTLNTGNWYFIVCEKRGTNEKVYVNDVLVLESSNSFDNSIYPFSIIGNYTSIGASQGSIGTIDEVSVWNRVLNPAEKTLLYNGGAGLGYPFNQFTSRLRPKENLFSVSKKPQGDFNPTAISGCKLWIDISKLPIVSDGTSISSITDLSGNGNNLSQRTAPQNPKYYSNAINGLPVMRHTASAQSTWDIPWTYSAPNTFFYVGKLGTTKQRLLSGRNNNWLLGVWGSYMNQAYFEGWIGANSDLAADTNAHVWSGFVNSTSYLFNNGSQVKTGTGGVTAPANLCIGYQGTSEFSDGDIGEIIGYNRQLTTDERYQVEQYLKAKWGIN